MMTTIASEITTPQRDNAEITMARLQEAGMDVKDKMSRPVHPINRWPSAAQRRAAEAASLLGKQARLKQEAAERRAHREHGATAAASTPQQPAGAPPNISP